MNPIFNHAIRCELVKASADDLDVVNAARISLDSEHPALEAGDAELISFLMRNRHGSPFEHGYFKFRVEAPIFVFREHHRHRVGHSYNEMSGRYTELQPHFYLPETWRTQVGKPGAYSYVELEDEITAADNDAVVIHAYTTAWDSYQDLLAHGVAKEQARIVLPVGIFSKMIWSCNPRSLMHFLGLRLSPHAQKEIRLVAHEASLALAKHMPITAAAFYDQKLVCP